MPALRAYPLTKAHTVFLEIAFPRMLRKSSPPVPGLTKFHRDDPVGQGNRTPELSIRSAVGRRQFGNFAPAAVVFLTIDVNGIGIRRPDHRKVFPDRDRRPEMILTVGIGRNDLTYEVGVLVRPGPRTG